MPVRTQQEKVLKLLTYLQVTGKTVEYGELLRRGFSKAVINWAVGETNATLIHRDNNTTLISYKKVM